MPFWMQFPTFVMVNCWENVCLSDTELGRLALTCHFALDCLGDLWGTTVEGDGYLSEGYAREDVFVTEW